MQAWERVQTHLGTTFYRLHVTRTRRYAGFLQSPDPQRRRLLRGALVLGGVGVGATLIGRQSKLLTSMGADLSTTTAQRRDFKLPDALLRKKAWITEQ